MTPEQIEQSSSAYRHWSVFVLMQKDKGDAYDGWRVVGGTIGGPYTGPEAIAKQLAFGDFTEGRWAFAVEHGYDPIYGLYYADGIEEPVSSPRRAQWGIYERAGA